jgi:hypothetical protein
VADKADNDENLGAFTPEAIELGGVLDRNHRVEFNPPTRESGI